MVLNQIDCPESRWHGGGRLLDALSQPIVIGGHELVVTPSIGIAVAPGDANDVDGLLKAADTAMYHAKAAGKNNCLFYHSDMDAASVDRLQLDRIYAGRWNATSSYCTTSPRWTPATAQWWAPKPWCAGSTRIRHDSPFRFIP